MFFFLKFNIKLIIIITIIIIVVVVVVVIIIMKQRRSKPTFYGSARSREIESFCEVTRLTQQLPKVAILNTHVLLLSETINGQCLKTTV